MKQCIQCKQDIPSNGRNNNVKYCSTTCYKIGSYESRKLAWIKQNNKRSFITNPDKRQCPYCIRAYIKLASHTWQVHDISARELKNHLGLDTGKGLIPEDHRQLLRKHVQENKSKVVDVNLLLGGIKSRFKKNHTINYKRSLQTLARLKHI